MLGPSFLSNLSVKVLSSVSLPVKIFDWFSFLVVLLHVEKICNKGWRFLNESFTFGMRLAFSLFYIWPGTLVVSGFKKNPLVGLRLSRFFCSCTAVLFRESLNSIVTPNLTSCGVKLRASAISFSILCPKYLQFSWKERNMYYVPNV